MLYCTFCSPVCIDIFGAINDDRFQQSGARNAIMSGSNSTTRSICKQAATGRVVFAAGKKSGSPLARDSSQRGSKNGPAFLRFITPTVATRSIPDEVFFHTYCMTLFRYSIDRKYRELRQCFLPLVSAGLTISPRSNYEDAILKYLDLSATFSGLD